MAPVVSAQPMFQVNSRVISVVPKQCVLIDDFINRSKGDYLFDAIYRQTKWHQPTIKMFGKLVESPRLSAWYGDQHAIYRYSGNMNIPMPWSAELLEIRTLVEAYIQRSFNSVLLNLYRNGNDSMGRHSDDEPELGISPTIASLSLGATRRFILHPNQGNQPASIKINLKSGSLLVMFGTAQRNWQHSLPKTRCVTEPRINLTYRWVNPNPP